MLQRFENWLASKLHERAKSRALHRFGGIQRCPWCKQWAQLHEGWHFDSKTDPTIDALYCGNCGGVSRWRFEHGMMPLEPIGLSPPPVQLSSADVAVESAKPLDTWPEYETDIPDAFDAYMTELVGNVDRRNWAHFPATFRWHEFWDHVGAAIARRGKSEPAPQGNDLDEAVHRAAVQWCGEKDRETFPEDIAYFRENWRAFPPMRTMVATVLADMKQERS